MENTEKLWSTHIHSMYDGVVERLKDISKSLYEQTGCLKGSLKPILDGKAYISFNIQCDIPKINYEFIRITFFPDDFIEVETKFHNRNDIKYYHDISEFNKAIDEIITSKSSAKVISHLMFLHKKIKS